MSLKLKILNIMRMRMRKRLRKRLRKRKRRKTSKVKNCLILQLLPLLRYSEKEKDGK